VPAVCVVKCFGFESPDAHLAAAVGHERIHSPLYITPRVLLMKGERNTSGITGPAAAQRRRRRRQLGHGPRRLQRRRLRDWDV
jgi:hypothetical protein